MASGPKADRAPRISNRRKGTESSPKEKEKAATLLHTLTIVNAESTMSSYSLSEACSTFPMRRTKEDAEKTRAAILDAAERLFLERGVAHTSLEHIARAAGVIRGAVYWHFQNKADLFNAMLNQVRLPPEQIAEKLSSDPQLSVNSLRDMCILALQNLMQNEQKRQILTILMQRCEVTDELRPAMDRHNQFIQQVVDVFERLLAEAERHGQLHPGISARQAARAVHALLLGLINDLLRDPQCLDPQTDGAAIFDALFRGLIRERA